MWSQGSLTCRKSATWDKRLYFPSEGRYAEEFFARTRVPKASMLNTSPPKPLATRVLTPSVLCIDSMPSHLIISLFLWLCCACRNTTKLRKSAMLFWVPGSLEPPGNEARDVSAHRKLSDRFLSTDTQTALSDLEDEWPQEQDRKLQVGHHELRYCSMASNRSYSRDTRTCLACTADVRLSTRAPSKFLSNAGITVNRILLTRSTARDDSLNISKIMVFMTSRSNATLIHMFLIQSCLTF
jgi:hypothetical protein